VIAAATFVLDDDLVGGGSSDGNGSAGSEAENIRPLRPFPNDQISQHRQETNLLQW
jgi:hypothetical protein